MSSFASNEVLCEDPTVIFSEPNKMMIKERSSGGYEILDLVVGGEDYLPDGVVKCKVDPKPRRVRGTVKIYCVLPDGQVANIHYVDEGKGQVGIYNVDDKLTASFSSFECY